MYYLITLGFIVLFYAKPIYWIGRITYLYYLHFNKQDIQTDAPEVAAYKHKLAEWLSLTWDYVRWQKSDL